MAKRQVITDDTQAIIDVFPARIASALVEANHSDKLIEIIADMGKPPVARFMEEEIVLSDQEITHADIESILKSVGDFDSDHRAGLPKTLHRISAILNRRGQVVGLTCRVGRAVYGMGEVIEDLAMSGKSILILGKPGVGKTTLLREAARMVAEQKRVVIVDTSNEIGGDGDVPHPGVGKARRMQVASPALQHEVMIEAVENHNPQAIVIDEIGRQQEAAAARTIAERGVQLIATAHGFALENLVQNPVLSDLVGGVENVVLSDEEARNRGTQKTVRERKAPPTFDVLVEIISFKEVRIYHDLADAVDCLLRGFSVEPEVRYWDENGQLIKEECPDRTPFAELARVLDYRVQGSRGGKTGKSGGRKNGKPTNGNGQHSVKLLPSGVSRRILNQVIRDSRLPVILVKDVEEADALVFLKDAKRRQDAVQRRAENLGLPIHTVSANSTECIETFLFQLAGRPGM